MSIVAGELNNWCYLLVIALTTPPSILEKICIAMPTDEKIFKNKVARMTGNVILPMMLIAVTDWFSLHNSIYGLYVDRKSCGFCQYYNAPLPFTYQQVAYELYFIIAFL